MTAFGTVPDAVAAIRAGAGDYLTKPVAWKDLQAIAERLTETAVTVAASAPDGLGGTADGAGAAAVPDRACFEREAERPVGRPQMDGMTGENSPVPIRQLERLHLEKTLAMTRGNRTHAAEMLGISLRTVRNKIREYGLPPRRYA